MGVKKEKREKLQGTNENAEGGTRSLMINICELLFINMYWSFVNWTEREKRNTCSDTVHSDRVYLKWYTGYGFLNEINFIISILYDK